MGQPLVTVLGEISMTPTKVGIVGCGNISGIYCKNGKTFEIFDVVACADLIPERRPGPRNMVFRLPAAWRSFSLIRRSRL